MGLYLGALLLSLGLAALVLLILLRGAPASSVAHSLALVESAVGRQEVARNDLPAADRLVEPLLARTRRLAVALTGQATVPRLTRLLDVAGNPPGWSVERLLGLKGGALLLGGVLGLLYGHLSLLGVVLAAALGAAGFYLPDLLAYNMGLHRQEDLQRGLADALDMLTVCVEAGQGFDAALDQVARAVTGPIAGEFARILQEIAIGRSRADAFGSFAARTSVQEIKTFVTALVQADRLGLPIGNVLREQAQEMRLVRRQRAEETAQKVPVKIMVPMVLCIFPILFVIVVGPGALRIVDIFSH